MILHHQFVKTARQYGAKKAVIDCHSNTSYSYSKLLIAALIFAKRILKMHDCYIGIMLPNSAGSFICNLATVMTGKIPVMINYSIKAKESCNFVRQKCGFSTILTSRALLDKIGCPYLPGMICLEDLLPQISKFERLIATMQSALPIPLLMSSLYNAKPDDTVAIMFTSGSEKDPKAVQLTHRNISANLLDVIPFYQLSGEDVILSILPLFHVFGLTIDFWLPMTTGMTAVTYPNPLDYKRVAKIISQERATVVAATPVFFGGYLRESTTGDFDSVRLLVAGADKTPDWIREGYRIRHQKTLLDGYGTTETSPVISSNTHRANRPGSIGRPLPSVQVRIVDIISGAPLPIGAEGKIMVKGDLVMKGYLNDIEETVLRIRDGWYDTGDMGVIDADGFLWHRGRLRRFVKIGGEMISLVRIESFLESLLPFDCDFCAVEIPDSSKGARICVAVTVEINEREIIHALRKSLSPIAVPSQFVYFESLPKMGNGKIDFRTITLMVCQKLHPQFEREIT